jgi:hypothetical protein
MNFNDLVNRSQIVSEGNVSPYEVKNPVFKDITKRLKAAGASSPPRDTMLVIINVLKRLEIISQEDVTQWESIKGSSTLPRKNALLGFIDLYKEDIIRRAEEVKETIEDELPRFFKRAGTNRGAAKGPSRGETKYSANQAAEEMKAQAREQKKEAKKLATELRQQAKGKGKGPRAAAAVEVIATGLDDSVARAYAAGEDVILKSYAAEVFKYIGKNLGKEGLDIDLKNVISAAGFVADKISTLDQLKRFVDQVGRKPGFELIAQYLADIIKPVEDAISASKSEDEESNEYNASKADVDKDGTTEPWEERLAKKRRFTESTTAEYLTEQVKKDKYNKASTEASLSFTEKFKPKTSWQLQELRNYGL